MIKEMIFLASSGAFSGTEGAGTFLERLAEYGVFEYMLPFLLLFALVYGVLYRLNLFKDNRGVDGIIAFVVALMALQFGFVSQFFSELFPRFGVGMVILLVLLILTGLFIPYKQTWISYLFLGIGAIILIIILVTTSGYLNWSGSNWWYDNWMFIGAVVVLLIALGIIVGGGSSGGGDHSSPLTNLIKAAAGDK
jgi:peptidoglycan/LPS O-acetylase OafA/YrhL